MPRYRRTAFGSHSLPRDGKRVYVAHGEAIECEDWELGGFINEYECLDPPPSPPEPIEKKQFQEKHIGHGRYNVIQPETGKPINDKPLTKGEADSLLADKPEDETKASDTD